MFRPDWHRHLRPGLKRSGAVHFILIGVILSVGVLIGLNWKSVQQTDMSDFAAVRVQAARTLQNFYAATSNFLAQLNFWSKPNEGGISVPVVSPDNYIPGRVPVDALTSPERQEAPHTAEPAAQPLDHAH
ncbi:MAG: hypothetical protein WBK91_03010 [Alphaproteobacteria bacterium]